MVIFFVSVGMIIAGAGIFVPTFGTVDLGFLVLATISIITTLISMIGTIRFAQKSSIYQSSVFGAIFEHTGTISWMNYIIALIVLWIAALVFGAIVGILVTIPVLGWLIAFFLSPFWVIFAARYMTQIYESAPAPA